jgi:hypothetical protein
MSALVKFVFATIALYGLGEGYDEAGWAMVGFFCALGIGHV